jgi:hypothetical protein
MAFPSRSFIARVAAGDVEIVVHVVQRRTAGIRVVDKSVRPDVVADAQGN